MSFDLHRLRNAVAAHGVVARVVVAEVAGSAPREVGASMLVWRGGQDGTIGGGALEYEAAREAFSRRGVTRHPLGPALGQCCGGSVTLLTERFDADCLPVETAVFARGAGEVPLSVRRLLDRARGRGDVPAAQLLDGWMMEPMLPDRRALWIWGAGHVGRALVDTLAPLPGFAITWVDTGPERFPKAVPDGVTVVPAAEPARLMPHAPEDAAHLILTYSHALDLALCDAALRRGFGFCGVIGSDTKWVRFSKRLATIGHPAAQIDRVCCPIGHKALGKHPQAIAIGVASQLLTLETGKGQGWKTYSSASTG